MNVLTAIINGIAGFVRRNPLLILIILVLAVGAPAVLKGIALFILYGMLGVIIIILAFVLWVRWNMRQARRRMDEQGYRGFGSASGQTQKRREGEVRVHRTADTPEKRVSKDVGDYVDFEETKEPAKDE